MQRALTILTVVSLFCALGASESFAATYVFPASGDNWMEESNGEQNHGTDDPLRADNSPGDRKIAMMQFDISSIGSGETITSATLSLNVEKEDGTGFPVRVFHLTQPWKEGSANWKALGAHVDSSKTWASFPASSTGPVLVDVQALVERWHAGVSNFGLALVPTAPGEESRYSSKEASTGARRPELRINTTSTLSLADIRVTKSVNRGNPTEADSVQFTISAINSGLGSAFNVTIQDPLPDGLTYITNGQTKGSYNPVTGTWTIGSLSGFASAQLNLVARIDAGTAGQTITNWAWFNDPNQEDSNAGNDSDSASVVVGSLSGADLATMISVSDTMPSAGQAVTLTYNVQNHGPWPANNVRIGIPDPTGLSLGPGFPSQGSYESGNQRWLVGTLPSGGTAQLSVAATVDLGTGGQTLIAHTFVQSSDETDLFPANDADTTRIFVQSADLIVTTFVDNPNPAPGDSVTLKLLLENAGPTGTTGVSTNGPVPAGLTTVGHSVSTGSYDEPSGLWTVDSLATGVVDTLHVIATVDSGTAGSLLEYTANVASSDVTDPDPTSNADTVAMTVASADLALTKTVDDPRPVEGQLITYRVTLTNTGPDAASDVAVRDLLPAGVTFSGVGATTGSYVSGTGVWTVGAVGSGATEFLDILATVDAGRGGTSIENVAFLTASSPGDINAANDTSAVSIDVQGADLAVTKTVSNPGPNEGDSIIYTVVVQNDGPDSTGSVLVNDPLPAGLTFQFATPSQGGYDDTTGVWNVGDLGVGGSASLALLVGVDPGTAGTVLSNTAFSGGSDLPDANAANDSMSAPITVQAADLTLTKRVSNATPLVGSTITYTLDLINAGPDSATSVIVTDQLPAGLTYLTHTAGQDYTSGSGVWNVGTVAGSDTTTLAIVAAVNSGTNGQTIWNFARVTGVDQADPNPGGETDSASIAVGFAVPIDRADLVIDVAADVPNPSEGGTVHYTITLTNNGPDPSLGVVVSDLLPTGVSFVASTPSRGTYSSAFGQWTVGAIANSEILTLDLEVTVDSGTAGRSLRNAAAVSSSSVSDPNPGNSSDFVDILVRNADLGLTQVVDQASPNEGDAVTFTITLSNAGPDTTTGVAVTSLLPTGLSYASDVPSRGSYASGTGVWTVGDLAVSDTVSLAITATVDPGTGGRTLSNPALITASAEGDSVPADNSAAAEVVVLLADLEVTKTVDDGTPEEGDTVTFTITAMNHGPDAATGVEVTDLLPVGLSWQSDVPSQGSYNPGTGVWTVGAVGAGFTASLDLVASVDLGTNGTTIWNTAALSASAVADSNGANDADSARVDIPLIKGISVGLQQPSKVSNPGDANVGFASITLANSLTESRILTSLALDNVTVGPGNQAELDGEFGLQTLYRDDGDFLFEPLQDTPLAQASVSAGRLVFTGLNEALPGGAIFGLHVGGSVSLAARTGDQLDFEVSGPGDVVFDQGVIFVSPWPATHAGAITVGGMTAAEITVSSIVNGSVTAGGAPVLAFHALLPANGYAADVLNELRVTNLGDAIANTDYTAAVWVDGGNGTFDHGTGDDTSLGAPVGLGATWELTGLSKPIPTGGLRVFVTAQAAVAGVPGREIQLVIPGPDGVITAGAHDGPVDMPSATSGTLTMQAAPTVMEAVALAQTSSSFLPGAAPVRVYAFRVRNTGTFPETLQSVRLTNRTTGGAGATQADLDADWGALNLTRDRSIDASGVGRQAAGVFSSGTVTFTGLDEEVAAGDSAQFVVTGSASLIARDGDQLDLSIEQESDLTFGQPVVWTTSFPLHPAGSYPVDGFVSRQVPVGPVDPSVLTGEKRRVSLDVIIPPNGYEDDTLLRFDVVNLGTAANGLDIERVEAWLDNGDDVFSAASDTLLGELTFTGQRWERTGLSVAVESPGGSHLFVTTDIADLATAGATVQLAIPAAPDFGVGVASNNDGPIDQVVASSPQVISTVDRVSITPISRTATTALPGDTHRVLLQLAAENNYSVTKTLTAITLTNVAVGPGTPDQLDSEFEQLSLWIDNGNGVFDGAPADTSLGTAFFDGGLALFSGIAWNLPAGATRHLWATGNVSLTLATDGDVLGAEVSSQAHVSFSDVTSIAAGFPLDSGARFTIDGMRAAQIANYGAPSTTIGPNEGPVLALDLGIPGNGYEPDALNELTLVNLGNAGPADLADVRLWRDGGDGSFDQGGVDDTDLGALVFAAGQWFLPGLSESLGVGSSRFFVSVIAGGSPTDSATVRFSVPTDGITVQSNNDGPRDQFVVNPDVVLLSTAVLLAEIRITPSASTVDSTVTVTMDVRNLHPSAAIDSVMPSALAPSGLGVLDPLTGPIPAEFSLGISEEKTFTWTYRAASSGDVRLSGSASGVEAGGGGSHASLPVTSNAHQIFVQAQDLNVFAVESMPFSISLGQTGVVPLSLTFENPAGVGGSDIRLLGLRIRLEDELGNTLVPSDLLARVVVNEGAVVYLDKSALETTATEMDLTLAQPVLIESSGSSSSATLAIALDISDSTSVPNFLMRVVDATWFEAEDATSGGPVIVSLIDPPAFPITSGLARVVAEATQVDVMNVAGSDFTVGQGQPDVAMLTIELDNPDPTGLAADARVTTFCVSLMDTAGVPIPAPAGWIQRIRVDGASLNHLNRSIGAADSSLISLALPQLVSVPVNTIVPLTVSVDVTSTSALGAFRMELADSSLFDARDANTGSPIPAIYSSHPVSGPLVTVESPANAAEAAGVARIPAEVSVGSVDVPALSVVLAHPGPGNSGPIRVDELTLLCRDGAGNALSPATFLDRVRVRVDSAGVALVTDLPGTGGQLSVPISAVSIAPFAQVSLDVYLDVEVTAPASLFAVQVAADGILAVDGNLSVPVAVGPASGAEFPLTSGFTQFRTPARDLVVAFQDAMPPVLVADEQTLEVMNLSLTNPTETGGDIRVNGFQFLGADRDRTPIDLGSAIASLQAWVGDSLWAETGPIDPAAVSVDLVAAESLLIAANTTIDVRVEVTLTGEPVDGGLRLGLDASGVSVVQPDSPLLVVSVQAAEGGAFPYWTESGNFSGVTLRESYSNFPNPFAAGREDTQIAFYLERAGQVSLKVYTLRGEPVRTLLNGASLGAGLHQDTTWDGRNGRGTVVLNGVYLAEISVKFDDGSGDRIVRKVAVVR